jgi:hypothetical protein
MILARAYQFTPYLLKTKHMPKALERKLKAEARKKGLKGKKANAYVYGTMRKTGWTSTQKKHVAITRGKKV